MKLLGVELTPWGQRLQNAIALFATISIMCSGVICFIVSVFLLRTSFYWIPLVYLAWFWYDIDAGDRGGRRLRWFRGLSLWKRCIDYFPIRCVKTADLDPNRNYILGYHPHGFTVGAMMNFCTPHGFEKLFPEMTPYLLTLSAVFKIPFHRDVVLAGGGCSVNREGIEFLLTKKGTGNAIVLMIGGVAEQLDAHPRTAVLTLKRRKGFVKLALKHGASLVPMFTFGDNDVSDQISNPPGSLVRKFQDWVANKFGLGVTIIVGRGSFIHRTAITTVIGQPIDLEQIDEPTHQQIDDIHQLYMDRLRELYETNKDTYGASDVELIIK